MIRRVALVAALVGVTVEMVAVVPRAARAAGPSPDISLDIAGCPSLPRQEVLRLAALELDARVVAASAADKAGVTPGTHVTQIQIACSGAAVQTTVVDPITGKQLTRTLDLPAQGGGVAARTVALAAAELVITSWMELTLGPERQRASLQDPTPPSDELLRAAQDRAERRRARDAGVARVLLVGQAAGPFAGMGLAWGGGLRLGWTFARRWVERGQTTGRPGVDLELTETRTDVESALGTVRAATWSAALRATFTLRRGRTSLDLGGGGRFGLARLTGAPADASHTRGGTLAGTWAGPIAYAGVGLQARHVVVAAGIEAGQVVRTVDALVDGATPVSIAGHWFAGSLAMGWGQ